MEYLIETSQAPHTTDCLVVGVFEEKVLTPSAKLLDKQTQGLVSQLLHEQDIEGKVGQTLLVPHVKGTLAKRLLLVGCGRLDKTTDRQFIKIAQTAMSALATIKAKQASCALLELNIKDRDVTFKIQQLIQAFEAAIHPTDELKSTPKPKISWQKIFFPLPAQQKNQIAQQAIEQAKAITAGVALTKRLANLPANICTPTYLAKEAQQLQKQFKTIKTTLIDEAEMKKLGMNALLSVSRGSDEPAKFIVLQYQPTQKTKLTKPVVFVGKGITFDSGGISIKPAPQMDEMKYDMCGAATVLGVLHAAATLHLPIPIVGVMACSENLPSGHASKPGDIVKTLSGQTVEILNTDAEGRLVLCDALTYCKRFDPDVVIDIATLTGAMVISLGAQATGFMSNQEKLAKAIETAGDDSQDRVWQLPLWEEYQEALDSNFADMANVGDRAAGSITAACFLARFTKEYAWAHLDIAGTAWRSGKTKGATGRPVPLLVQYLLNRC